MMPGQLISWLDEHVEQHGDLKVIPPADYAAAELHATIRYAVRRQETDRIMREQEELIDKAVAKRLADIDNVIPEDGDLIADLRRYVEENRRAHWSHVVRSTAEAFCFQGAIRLSPIRRRRERPA
jgi:hypothetical protein